MVVMDRIEETNELVYVYGFIDGERDRRFELVIRKAT